MKTYKSSRLLAGLYLTKVVFPDRLEVSENKICITKRKWFGLIADTESISLERVASVRVKNGFVSAKVFIETMGGAKQDFVIDRLWKGTAKEIAARLD